MKTLVIANQKGGIGKTTTSLCLTDGLRECGFKVLLIDMDPQCNSTSCYNIPEDFKNNVQTFLDEECSLKDAIYSSETGDIIPNTKSLAGKEAMYTTNYLKVMQLKKSLPTIEDVYDFVIIDTPPNMGFFQATSMVASDAIIIPIMSGSFALDGLADILQSVESAKAVNEKLKVAGVLLVAYDKRNGLDKEIKAQLSDVLSPMDIKVFDTPIRVCQEVKKAQKDKTPLYQYAPSSKAAVDYAKVISELIKVI